MATHRPDWKMQVIYWGLGFLFLLKFLKFVVLEAWDVLGPLLTLLA